MTLKSIINSLYKTFQTSAELLDMQVSPDEDVFNTSLEKVKSIIYYDKAAVLLLEGDTLVQNPVRI